MDLFSTQDPMNLTSLDFEAQVFNQMRSMMRYMYSTPSQRESGTITSFQLQQTQELSG